MTSGLVHACCLDDYLHDSFYLLYMHQSHDTFCYLSRCFGPKEEYLQIDYFLFIKFLHCLDPPNNDADLWLVGNRWGPQFEKATYKNRQRLYLSEQASTCASMHVDEANCEV